MPTSVLKMPCGDPDGSDHANAIWIPASVIMDNIARQGGVEWYAYHDAAAYLSGKAPVAGVTHHTAIDQALYAAVLSLDCKTTIYGPATAYALTFLALHYADTPTGATDAATGQPVLAPFFAAATVVQIGP